MMKQLSFSVALLLAAAACKTDSPAPSSSGAAAEPAAAATTGTARSAKIDVKPVRPPPPSLTADDPGKAEEPADRPRRGGRMAQMDTNGDGVISEEERAAAMTERVNAMHARYDTDGDGKLTPKELANARGRLRFDNPEALDTNHDGEISTDELAAGMKAKREQWRANLNNRNGAPPAPDPEAAPGDKTP
jgi:Ca2+-binding EF-hand superfamily protein